MPTSPYMLPGLQWIPGINAVEVQQSSGLQIDAKTLAYTCSTNINVAQPDMWRAINGLLGLTNEPGKNRYYLGAPHPLFTETAVTPIPGGGTEIERIPMLWADSIGVTPLDDHYRGVNGEIFPGDGGNPQMLHFKTARLHVGYSNDSIHYSRIKCSCRDTSRTRQQRLVAKAVNQTVPLNNVGYSLFRHVDSVAKNTDCKNANT